MIKIESVDVYGWESAIRGMRNPMNSWDKSDSHFDYKNPWSWEHPKNLIPVCIGPNDLGLMKKLVKAGTDHRKFMRMINVTADITAPLYWWKEFDTYKVGTVRNSCSTMHTIHKKEFTLDDFSHEHLACDWKSGAHCKLECVGEWSMEMYPEPLLKLIVCVLNSNRNMYLQTQDEKYWWQIIQLLPSSYNQRATVQLNYEVLLNMYYSRKTHKLDEWRTFCEWVEKLPYMEELLNV